MAARLAAKMGYIHIKVFHAGTPAWQKAGHPLMATHGFVSKRLENVVLVDTRGPDAARQGHIEGAFAIALDQVIRAKDQFPLDTSVPVIFYAQDTGFEQIAKVVEELSLWVDRKMFVLEGGYQGWLKKGGPYGFGKDPYSDCLSVQARSR